MQRDNVVKIILLLGSDSKVFGNTAQEEITRSRRILQSAPNPCLVRGSPMNHRAALPEALKSVISNVTSCAEPQLAVATDMGEDRCYGECWLVLADSRLLVLASDKGIPRILHNLPFLEASPLQIEPLAGGGALQVHSNGRKMDLLYFTPALAKRFAEVCARLNTLSKGKSLPRDLPQLQSGRCPKCHLALGDGTEVCPRCLNQRAALWRLLGHIFPYRGTAIALSLLVLGGTLLKLLPPYITKTLVDEVIVPRRHPDRLLWLVIALAAAGLLGELLAIWRDRIAAWVSCRMAFDLRTSLYESLQWLNLRYYDRHPTGAVISRLTQDITGVQQFIAKEFALGSN